MRGRLDFEALLSDQDSTHKGGSWPRMRNFLSVQLLRIPSAVELTYILAATSTHSPCLSRIRLERLTIPRLALQGVVSSIFEARKLHIRVHSQG